MLPAVCQNGQIALPADPRNDPRQTFVRVPGDPLGDHIVRTTHEMRPKTVAEVAIIDGLDPQPRRVGRSPQKGPKGSKPAISVSFPLDWRAFCPGMARIVRQGPGPPFNGRIPWIWVSQKWSRPPSRKEKKQAKTAERDRLGLQGPGLGGC